MRILKIALTTVVAGIFFLRFVIQSPNASAERQGELIGEGVMTFLLAFVIGKIVWFVARRGKFAGDFAYVVSLILITISVFARQMTQTDWAVKAIDRQSEFREQALAHLADPENVAPPDPNAMFDAIQRDMKASDPNSDAGRATKAISKVMEQLQQSQSAWLAAQEAAINKDLMSLTSQEAVQKQITRFQAYEEATVNLENFSEEYISQMERALIDAEVSPEYRDGVIRGATNSKRRVEQAMKEMYAAHKDYAACMADLLQVMDIEWGAWRFSEEAGGFEFDNDTAAEQFNTHLDRAIAIENEVNEWSAEVLRLSQPSQSN